MQRLIIGYIKLTGRRQVCKSRQAGILLSADMQTFRYSPLNLQCSYSNIMNLENWGASAHLAPPPSTLLLKCFVNQLKNSHSCEKQLEDQNFTKHEEEKQVAIEERI